MTFLNRYFFSIAFGLGLLSVAWVGLGFLGTHLLALVMTLVIGLVYLVGAQELRQYRLATHSLSTALQAIPSDLPHLGDWLGSIHPSLQNAVRLRIEGERSGLPGPALTPYLVGLLVMLGMLGTFLGMVATLNGAVFALEGTGNIQAIRAAFSEPMKGLGLAFGTSVAGVATSAMLGLMSAFGRREREQAAQELETRIANELRSFSLTYQRQETFKALQLQSQTLPVVADQLQAMMHKLESMNQQFGEQWLRNQESFHSHVKVAYNELAAAVDQSLRDSMMHSAQVAGDSIKPVVESAMVGIAQDARDMHERLMATTQSQLDGMATQFSTTASTVAHTWTSALTQQEHIQSGLVSALDQSLQTFTQTFEQRSQSLLDTVNQAHLNLQQHAAETLGKTALEMAAQSQAHTTRTLDEMARLVSSSEELVRARVATEMQWTQQHAERMDQLATLLRTELSGLREEEAARGLAAVERLGELQTALTQHLSTLGTALEAPITRLIHTASEAPRAAAEVIGQLRQEMTHSVARDNELLQERSRILDTLNNLLDSIQHASTQQRDVIDSLVASSALALQQASTQFAERIDAEAVKLADTAAHLTSSSIEVSSLSESFGFAVNAFNQANEQLIEHLQRIEKALDKSMSRSDEQLAYYVAQAREVIDLSISSQKEIFDELRKLPAQVAVRTEEVS
jgi:hypothetical protein